jgi:hypothetical protein
VTWLIVVGGIGLLLVAAAAVLRASRRLAIAGAFLSGFGFGAAAVFPTASVSITVAAACGLAAGATAAIIALVLGRALPAAAPATRDQRPRVGSLGTVVSGIPVDGAGEVTLIDGQTRVTVPAQADSPIDAGAAIVVIDVPAEAAVRVAEPRF